MTKYAFVSSPMYGHVNPTLAVVQELVARGEEVIYYLSDEFKSAIEATGATFHSYQPGEMQKPQPQSGNGAPPMLGGMPLMLINASYHVIPQVLESLRNEQPDYIVYDFMCLWGWLVAQILHIPAINMRPSYAMNEHVNMRSMSQQMKISGGAGDSQVQASFSPQNMARMQEEMDKLCALYNVPAFKIWDLFTRAEELNIVFIPRAFQPGSETFDERYLFVGPSILPRHDSSGFPSEKLGTQPTLYISLGTVFNNRADIFNACFAAFGKKPWQIVLARGKNVEQTALDAIPDNFLVAPYVPQLEVLQRANAFITHGGMNSVMESLYYGVPLVVIPQMQEQAMTARRIHELGLGIALKPDEISVASLQTAVEQILHDPGYRERAQAMQQTIRAAGGYKQAADAMIGLSHSITAYS